MSTNHEPATGSGQRDVDSPGVTDETYPASCVRTDGRHEYQVFLTSLEAVNTVHLNLTYLFARCWVNTTICAEVVSEKASLRRIRCDHADLCLLHIGSRKDIVQKILDCICLKHIAVGL